MTSTFFANLTNSLGAKQRPEIVPLSGSLGPPGPQTCHSTSLRISSSNQTPTLLRPTFCSFRIPRRTHPFRSLLHLPRSRARRSICTVPFPIQHGRQQLPSAAGGVLATVKHDMQGDAVTVASVDMGTHRGVFRRLEGRGEPCAEAQGHRGCFAHGSGSGYECEVLPPPYLSPGLG